MVDGRLRVIFRGLFVFYPTGATVKVLLVDARKPESLLNYQHNFQEPISHTPLISIPNALFDTRQTAAMLPKYASSEDNVLGLTQYRIEIVPGSAVADPLVRQSDFDQYIPNIKELVPAAVIDPNVIDVTKLKNLSGFLSIDKGTIGIPSSQISDRRRATEFIKTKFPTAPAPQANAPDYREPKLYANSVYWDLKIPPTGTEYAFQIKFYLPDNSLAKSYDLKLPKNTDSTPIAGHIFITNMPTISENATVNDYFIDQPDRDFALSYQVLQTPVYTPLPQKVKDPDEEQTWPPLMCGIARFQ